MTEMNVDYCCGLKWQYATVEVYCQGTVSLRDNEIFFCSTFVSPWPFHLPCALSLYSFL